MYNIPDVSKVLTLMHNQGDLQRSNLRVKDETKLVFEEERVEAHYRRLNQIGHPKAPLPPKYDCKDDHNLREAFERLNDSKR